MEINVSLVLLISARIAKLKQVNPMSVLSVRKATT